MNNQFPDNEFDNLMNNSDLGLPPLQESAPFTNPFDAAPTAQAPQQDLSFFGKIPVNVTLEVASTEIPLKELMEVDTSSVIMLDKLAGEPLDVKVNGALFAKAEVVVMNGNYGLRILELTGTGLNGLAS
ncbi:flagellar motor switch protein FliN [Cellvibrio mixtus]|uniref:flagellar motor switch protein FliN n=1 Tax=Cellvibrio mixtus TaxID=39650 RepID=UPI0005874DB6|nr:flagellar motor switch protein FliN [Cellvibrio mixtus]